MYKLYKSMQQTLYILARELCSCGYHREIDLHYPHDQCKYVEVIKEIEKQGGEIHSGVE